MRNIGIACTLVLTLICSISVRAQSTANSGGDSSSAQVKSPADAAYESLGRDFSNFYTSLKNKGGVAPSDHAAIRAMRDRAAAFSREFPTDVRGPAMELMLSKWLNDDQELIDGLYQKIAQLQPDNKDIQRSMARMYKQANRYADALELLKKNPPDPKDSPQDIYLMAECQFAQQDFPGTIATLETLPADANSSQLTKLTNDAIKLKQYAKEYESLWPQEQAIRAKEEAADDLPRVTMVTSRGQITLELFENEAPNTVANFISLIDQNFYNGLRFHRVIANFMAQSGDPNSKVGSTTEPGNGNPGYYIPDETARDDHRNHFTGSLSMAKTSAPNTGGSQFFITVTPTPHLNGLHTVFGRVIEGLDVVRSLKENDTIEMMTVTRRRVHEYKPKTLPLDSPATQPATQPSDTQPSNSNNGITITTSDPSIKVTPVPAPPVSNP